MIKGVLFDMDTHVNNAERSLANAWRAAAKQLQLPLAEADIAKLLGTHESERAAMLHTLLGKDGEELQQLAATLREDAQPQADALKNLCADLHAKGVHTAFASTKLRTRCENYLGESGLQDAFDVFVTGAEFINRKPAPDMYEVALERLDISAENAMLLASGDDAAAAAETLHLPLLFIGGENASAVASKPTLADAATWLEEHCVAVPQEDVTVAEEPSEEEQITEPETELVEGTEELAKPAEEAEETEPAQEEEPTEKAEHTQAAEATEEEEVTQPEVTEAAVMGFAEFAEQAEPAEFAEMAEDAQAAEIAEASQEPEEQKNHFGGVQQWPSKKDLEETVLLQLKKANLLEADTEAIENGESATAETVSALEKLFQNNTAEETDAPQADAEKPAKKEKKPKKEKAPKAESEQGKKNPRGTNAAAVVCTVVVLLLILLFGAGYIVCHGPSMAARDAFVTAMNDSAVGGFIPHIFLSEGEIAEITAQNTTTIHQPVDLTDTRGETESILPEDVSSDVSSDTESTSIAENTIGASDEVDSAETTESDSASDSSKSIQKA